MNKQTTIKDIAKELGMHHTTVSRALRNHPDVNEETRKIVLEKAEELNYIPNTFATGLRNNQSKTIGILVPSIRPNFFSSTISYITNLAHQEGYSVMIFQSNEDLEMEKQNLTALLQHRVAGIIVSVSKETNNINHFKDLEANNIPVVYFDRVPKTKNVDKVQINNFRAGYDAVRHMVEIGRKRIAFYSASEKISVIEKRLEGYNEAVKDFGINHNQRALLKGDLTFDDGYKSAKSLIKMNKMPDAVICSVDQVAFGMMKAFHENEIKIPEQIALLGFDNDPSCEMVQPSLSTIAQPIEEIAKNALAFLLQRINGKDKLGFPLGAKLNMNLIKRESTKK